MNSHGRRPSNVSTTSSIEGRRSSLQYGGSSSSPQQSRRSSRNYGISGAPISRTSSNMGLSGGAGGVGGLGGADVQESLADELAGAWDDDYEDDEEEEENYGDGEDLSGVETEMDGTEQLDGLNATEKRTLHRRSMSRGAQQPSLPNAGEVLDEEETKPPRDSGVAVDMDIEHGQTEKPTERSTTPATKRHRRTSSATKARHSRQRSRYDGSEFDDAVASGTEDSLPASLASRIDEIAWLASRPGMVAAAAVDDESAHPSHATRQTFSASTAAPSMATVTEEGEATPAASSSESAIPRLTSSLRGLSTVQQASLETHTSRLVTSHTALATHLAYQTRNIQSLSFPIMSPLSAPPDEADVDSLLPLLLAALEELPQPAHVALASLSQLSSATTALLSSLAAVSDSLHMSRQTMTVAARRLRSAREAAAELRREQTSDEQGRAWIQRGNWDQKLRDRDAQRVCRDVVAGFEDVCAAWRQRLLAAAAAIESSSPPAPPPDQQASSPTKVF